MGGKGIGDRFSSASLLKRRRMMAECFSRRTVLFLLAFAAENLVALEHTISADAPPRNAALQYMMAFELMPDVVGMRLDLYTTDNKKVGFGVPVSQAFAEKFFQGQTEQSLKHLYRGAALSECQWPSDLRRDGWNAFEMRGYGNRAQLYARVPLLRARCQFERGDWEKGIDDVIATMVMSRHITRDRLFVTAHWACMIEGMCCFTAAAYLPRMPPEARVLLVKRLDSLPSYTSMREAMLHYERIVDWFIDNARQAEREGRLSQFLARFPSYREAQPGALTALHAESLVKLAEEARPLLRECADLMRLAPEECDRVYKQRFESRLTRNAVTAMVAPLYPGERREEGSRQCRLALLKAAIDVVARGKAALADHPDPFGRGPFEYTPLDGGFLLRSELTNPVRIDLRIGRPKT